MQVGSFNYDMSRMVFINEFVPNEEDAIQSILDYGIEIRQDVLVVREVAWIPQCLFVPNTG